MPNDRVHVRAKKSKRVVRERRGAFKTAAARSDFKRVTRKQINAVVRKIVDEFNPEKVILFGSYACGQPNRNSDVDLLIVKDLKQSSVREAAQILKAWRPIRWSGDSIPFELLIETPAHHEERAKKPGSFYAEVVRSGLRLA